MFALSLGFREASYPRGASHKAHAHLAGDVRAAVRDSTDPALPTNITGLRCAASR